MNTCKALPILALSGCLALWALPVLAEGQRQTRVVTASAYTTRPSELASRKSKKTACEDRLDPKSKGQTIAVSMDLVKAGLDCGMVVKIDGLSDGFVVTDHMPPKVRNHIDIFVGNDVKMAKQWSKRRVTISWTPEGPVK